MGIFLLLILAVVGACYFWVKNRYSYWSDRGFASPKPKFPFGSFSGVGSKITSTELMDVLYKNYKDKAPVVGMYMMFQPMILPIDPELIKNIFVRDFASFHDRGFYYNKEDDPLSANMFSIEGKEWRDRRVKLSPIFTSGKMKMMFDIVETIGENFAKTISQELETSKLQEMSQWAGRYTADVIGNVAFGLDFKCITDPDSEFLKHGHKFFNFAPFELVKLMLANSFPDLAKKLHFAGTPKEPAEFFMRTFLQTLEYREKNKIQRNDFVSMLLGFKEFFTQEELAAESLLVFQGGFETSSTLLTFLMYELAINPDIQQRLRVEIQEGLEENDGKITYDMLFGFKYLDMVVNEGLRKYPPVPNQIRKCTKEYKIDGTDLVVPVGTPIQIPTFSLHRDPEYFPDPETFDPERFTPENSKARIPITFSPFGDGPRNCIGMRFGLMQSKIGLVKLLTNFEFSPSERTPIPMKFVPSAVFLTPVGGMWLKLQKIN